MLLLVLIFFFAENKSENKREKEMKALKELKEHRARRGSDEEEEETEETIWKPGNGKGQQKVWSLRDSGDDFAMFSFKIGTSDGPKTGRRELFFRGRQEAISRFFF
jgi:hypothetical protein